MIVQGAILPHAPLFTRAIRGPGAHLAGRVKGAIRRLRFAGADALVILSPHGETTGVYARGRATLRRFGLDRPDFDVPVHRELTSELSDELGAPLLADDLDHGVVVPLALLHGRLPVAAATIQEDLDPGATIEWGRSFARAVAATDTRVVFVASANTSAALSPRAPLGLRDDAQDVERRLIDHLIDGTGDGDAILRDLAEVGGSCGAGPLAAFAELFAGKVEVLAHEAPFGVGYLVATATP